MPYQEPWSFETLTDLLDTTNVMDGTVATADDATDTLYLYSAAFDSWMDLATVTTLEDSLVGRWFSTTGTPDTAIGDEGDFAFDTTTQLVYRKAVTYATITAATAFAPETGSVSGSSFTTTGTLNPTANNLYLAFVVADTSMSGATMSGAGLIWELATSVATSGPDMALFRAMESDGVFAETLTVNFGGSATGYQIHVLEVTGAATTGASGSDAVVQAHASAPGASVTSYVYTLLEPFQNAANATVAAFIHLANEATTPIGLTELGDTSQASPLAGVETQWILAEADPGASWLTASRAGVIGAEIAASPSVITWSVLGALGTKPAYIGFENGSDASAQTAMAANNDAILIPFKVDAPCTISTVWTNINTSSGNLDIGIYNQAGTTRYAALGSTASPGTGLRSFTFGSPASLTPGQYWLAVANSTTAFRYVGLISTPLTQLCRRVATAFPLPSTITPGSTVAGFVPQVIGVVT